MIKKNPENKRLHIPAHSRKAIQRQLACKELTNRRIKNQGEKKIKKKREEDSKILLVLFTQVSQEDALDIKSP